MPTPTSAGLRWARGIQVPAVALALALVASVSASPVDRAAAGEKIAYEKAATQVLLRTKLKQPSALAFHPRDGSLWILNHGNNSLTIVVRPALRTRQVVRVVETVRHYLWNPTGIAFSRDGSEFATAQDAFGDRGRMGPTLWPGQRSKFRAGVFPQSIHLDMLHHSPHSVGIAAGADESRREYWVFNGHAGSIDRYFFNKPHPPGASDHSDGLAYRYADGQLARRANLPGHLALDRAGGHLYIADTANRRVARLETPASTDGARMIDPGWPSEGPLYLVQDTAVETVIPPSAGLGAPSGLVLHAGKLWVGDYATGRIHVFRLDATPVRVIDTRLGPNSLTGFAVTAGGWIYALDSRRNHLVRLRASR